MRAEECIALIKDGVRRDGVQASEDADEGDGEGRGAAAGESRAPVWADLGSGGGAFTAALAALLGPGAVIWSVDVDARALRAQEREMARLYPAVKLKTLAADFTGRMDLPRLDGVVLANSLHYQPDPCAVLARLAGRLQAGGRVIIVEYDIQKPNPWVPHPVPFSGLPAVADCAGLSKPRLLARRPSRYHGSMYAAVLTAR
jgi:SAM-dependent methyltransferase